MTSLQPALDTTVSWVGTPSKKDGTPRDAGSSALKRKQGTGYELGYGHISTGPLLSGTRLVVNVVIAFSARRRAEDGHTRHANPAQIPPVSPPVWTDRCLRKRLTEHPFDDVIDDDVIEVLAVEAEAGYDIAKLRRRGGRQLIGSAPAEVVPVRLDPELKAEVERRAEADHTTTSEIIRTAIRKFLDVA